ncbi:glutathione S-transferase family protein [Sphingomicrobium aestuariivivum]|uniref:glutathione S-transferase family protein n=1 Tax=Sphingomicrobium aestuariivivum TaxID=1582356 RepID=UPI001FD63A8B|nr:glutathione S-transferase family protein [Sphingomicrobium aestuariivivum]MCJ8191794.1 glutathione S-transferase family protein [Sphingomicrobium aestuariivivum]
MAITFYTNPMSRGGIVRWALHEVGADYETSIISYGEEMKGDYLASINPMGKVPAITHDGRIVTECAAICHYLAETHPDAGLLPTDAERAAYYRWLFFAAGPLEQAVVNRSMGFEVPDDPQKRGMVGYGHYGLVMDVIEQHFSDSDFAAGERFTMADVYLGSQVAWGLQFGTVEDRPALRAYAERSTDREAARQARAIDMKLIAEAQED